MVEGEENLYKVPKFKNGRKSKIWYFNDSKIFAHILSEFWDTYF